MKSKKRLVYIKLLTADNFLFLTTICVNYALVFIQIMNASFLNCFMCKGTHYHLIHKDPSTITAAATTNKNMVAFVCIYAGPIITCLCVRY